MAMAEDRELDVVLYGATGFVGRLTAAHLAAAAPDGVRVGLAGRSQQRLEEARDELGAPAARWPLIAADAHDRDAMEALARRSRVVASTVGPYRKYGGELVAACARTGTHYADLAGEILFMREVIDRHHATAAGTGARLVHTCGFDSIPSDLGVLLAHQAAGEDAAGELEDTTLVVTALRGGVSGGTIDSLRGELDGMRGDRSLARLAADPYALSPDRDAEPDLGDERELRGIERLDELGVWAAPFAMAMINTRVVRRSNALQGWAYGRRFRYREVMSVGGGPLAPVKGAAVAGGLAALAGGLSFGPTRHVLDRVLPDPGEGPDEEARRKGRFRIEVHARTSSGRRYCSRIEAQGDPGYAATAVMFAESALCLALGGEQLPDRAGALTPATAMGAALVERLRAVGHTYEAGPA
jgi:short subunit dehydrogenase-like uncharacterized protein